MRNVLFMVFVLLVSCSSARAGKQPVFDFEISVLDRKQADDVEVYGTFNTKEGQYGGIELAFFRETGTYSIRAIENMRDVAAIPEGKARRYDADGIDLILRLFISPMLTNDGDAYLAGTAMLMENTSEADTPLYAITEESFSGVVAIGGDTLLAFTAEPSGREVKVKLAVELHGYRHSAGRHDDYFDASFSLVNEDSGRFEIEEEPCELRLRPGRRGGESKCIHQRMFQLEKEDSLLYVVMYHIDEAARLDDGLIQIALTVERWFFVNPKRYFADQPPEDVEGKTYGTGRRETETTIAIDGKKRRVKAEIEDGTIVSFEWDDILFTESDIVRNWNDVVSIMTQIENNRFLYRPPPVDADSDRAQAGFAQGLIDNPVNYTGSKVQSTTYSKSFTIEPHQNVEIAIPLGKKSLLPFSAREIVKMGWPQDAGPR